MSVYLQEKADWLILLWTKTPAARDYGLKYINICSAGKTVINEHNQHA